MGHSTHTATLHASLSIKKIPWETAGCLDGGDVRRRLSCPNRRREDPDIRYRGNGTPISDARQLSCPMRWGAAAQACWLDEARRVESAYPKKKQVRRVAVSAANPTIAMSNDVDNSYSLLL